MKIHDKRYLVIPVIVVLIFLAIAITFPRVVIDILKGLPSFPNISIPGPNNSIITTSTFLAEPTTTYLTQTTFHTGTTYYERDRNSANYSGSIQTYPVGLKTGGFTPIPGIDENLKHILETTDLERIHVFIQIKDVDPPVRAYLSSTYNITFFNYFPENTYQASMPTDRIYEIEEDPYILWIGAILPQEKLQSTTGDFFPKEFDDDGYQKLRVEFFPDVPFEDAKEIIEKYGKNAQEIKNVIHPVIYAYFRNEMAINMGFEDVIKSVEGSGAKISTSLSFSKDVIGIDEIRNSPYDLYGYNIKILEYDDGVGNSSHPDLSTRLLMVDTDNVSSDHATHVAGILIGNGTVNNAMEGMAPKAEIISYGFPSNYNDENQMRTEYSDSINNYNVQIASNSWGRAIGNTVDECINLGNYDEISALFDEYARGSGGVSISILFAVGNERDKNCTVFYNFSFYNTTIPPSTSKNVISVGATDASNNSIRDSSGWGPTDDGRIKPDVVAPGCRYINGIYSGINSTITNATRYPYGVKCGTSMAAPHVSGTAALMIEQYRKTYGNGSYDNITPLPSSIKALLIHTTEDLNETGPDYTTGYGLINATRAVNYIIDKSFFEANITSQNETDEYNISVLPSQEELKVTLVWDDYPADANANPTLVNNLNLILESPNGSLFYPWILNASDPSKPAVRNLNITDDINNVEQVYVNESEIVPGIWKIRINGTVASGNYQNYSLVGPFRLEVDNLSVIHSNNTEKVFRFTITNNHPDILNDINWSLDIGETKIYASQNMTLMPAETAFVYIDHNYTDSDVYIINASATAGNLSDYEELTTTIGNLIVRNLSVVYGDATERIFRFEIWNSGIDILTHLNWSLDNGENNTINASQLYNLSVNETVFIYFQNIYNYEGNYTINVSAFNEIERDFALMNITV